VIFCDTSISVRSLLSSENPSKGLMEISDGLYKGLRFLKFSVSPFLDSYGLPKAR
jgi:hypothetical protein